MQIEVPGGVTEDQGQMPEGHTEEIMVQEATCEDLQKKQIRNMENKRIMEQQ